MAMAQLPTGAPATLMEAFGYIVNVKKPTVDDLKVMVLVEAAGLETYRGSAAQFDHPGVKALLIENGYEEFKHSLRVADAIRAMTGEVFPAPTPADNPYLQSGEIPSFGEATAQALRNLAQAEHGGKDLYEGWAQHCGNEEAARLFRMNGKEEHEHGDRLLEAAKLLEA
jgi:rubrerythrin